MMFIFMWIICVGIRDSLNGLASRVWAVVYCIVVFVRVFIEFERDLDKEVGRV